MSPGGPGDGAGYWYDSLRQPVEFDRAVRVLAAAGHRVFVEVSPHPVLAAAITETLEDTQPTADAAGPAAPVVTGTLRRDDGGPARFLASLAEVHVRGVAVDWPAVLSPRARRGPADLRVPAAAVLATPARRGGRGCDLGGAGGGGASAAGRGGGAGRGRGYLLTGRLSVGSQPWLADHAVAGTVLLPGTAFVELAVRAGDQAGCARVDELTLEAPLVLPADGAVQLQVTVERTGRTGGRAVEVYARAEDAGREEPWTRHASGLLTPVVPPRR